MKRDTDMADLSRRLCFKQSLKCSVRSLNLLDILRPRVMYLVKVDIIGTKIFKACIDVRYSEDEVVSHNATTIRSTPVESSQNILLLASDVDVVGIDEAQFFDRGIIDVCRQLADSGIRVIVAGLDMDYLGKPFGPMPDLMATAEYVTKVHAICVRCGNLAHHSHRLAANDALVMLGEKDTYEPICRHCFAELTKNEQ
jgi:thymidine kinase